MIIKNDTTINEVIHKYPETVKFFSDLNMSCTGCFAVHFDTLENGALMHGMDVNTLVQKLNHFVRKHPAAPVTTLENRNPVDSRK